MATWRARAASSRPSITTLSSTARGWRAVTGDCPGRSASFRLPPMSSHANASELPGPVSSLAGTVPAAITEFARRLRWLGVDVSVSEVADALRAISDADLLDRERLRGRLPVPLAKPSADIVTSQPAFDLLFPALAAAGDDGHAAGEPAGDDAAAETA